MALFFFIILLVCFINSSWFVFPAFIFFLQLYFLSSIESFFAADSLTFFGFADEASIYIVEIMLFILFVSFLFSFSLNAFSLINIVFSVLLFCCFVVFCNNNMFYLYLFYEGSLIPILYIILKWGSYPDRALSGIILLLYTAVFTFPFIYAMFSLYSNTYSFSFMYHYLLSSYKFSSFLTLIVFFTFAVKLPIYGLHFWLPIAHVEAPTFGSIILAGVLLKLGGVGLIRFSPLIDIQALNSFLLSYFIFSLVLSTFICCFQADIKRLIAYSSVSHIITIPLLMLSFSSFSVKSITVLMLFHGLSSPLLFILVGVLYSIFGTRQLVFMRGIILISPLISFIMVLAFFFTLSAPPFPSFFGEVFFVMTSLSLTRFMIPALLLFIFFSLVYNLNWFSGVVFINQTHCTSVPSSSLSFLTFISIFLCVIISFSYMLLLSFF